MTHRRAFWLAALGAFAASGCGASEPPNLRLVMYQTIKPPAEVRSCLIDLLTTAARESKTPAPIMEPFTASPRNTDWTIQFRWRGGPASIVVIENERVGGTDVIYPAAIGVADEVFGQSLEGCGS